MKLQSSSGQINIKCFTFVEGITGWGEMGRGYLGVLSEVMTLARRLEWHKSCGCLEEELSRERERISSTCKDSEVGAC